MRRFHFALAAALLAGCIRTASAQVVSVSEPGDRSLLSLPRRWSLESSLGDLRALDFGPDDLEVRAWGGFGLTSTEAVVLRRADGRWSARHARLVPCTFEVPVPVGDTASVATKKLFVERAKAKCGSSEGDVSHAAIVITADTLDVEALDATSANIERAWRAAVRAGLLTLPPKVDRKWMMLDGFTYVIEVRRGNEYRASVIEHVKHPEVAADSIVKQVYAALVRVAGGSRPARR